MELKIRCIPPDISEEERKINVESLFNSLCRTSKIENFSHCICDIGTNNIHIYLNRKRP
jgi:hypothetical protein